MFWDVKTASSGRGVAVPLYYSESFRPSKGLPQPLYGLYVSMLQCSNHFSEFASIRTVVTNENMKIHYETNIRVEIHTSL